MNTSEPSGSLDGSESPDSIPPVEDDTSKLTKIQELVYELKVRDAMTQNVVTITTETMMTRLREVLRSNRISGTPVTEGGKLAGVISIEDFIMWMASGKEDCPVRDMMITDIETVFDDEPLIQAVGKFEKTGFRRFPVIDRLTGRLVGIITKSDMVERLLTKLEIEYEQEQANNFQPSHMFEDIVEDRVTLTFKSVVKGKDFDRAGEVSSRLKKTLECLGIEPQIIRRVAIASYEAEMNLVIYTDGGTITASVQPDGICLDIEDSGPGIEDVDKAMQPGYSTASEWVRKLGFGAGMGLVNIKKCADKMDMQSSLGEGTHLRVHINLADGLKRCKAS